MNLKPLEKRLKKLESFSMNEALNEAGEKNEKFILDQIRGRLLKSGTTADGKQLRTDKAQAGNVYSTYTMILKEAKGQPTDRVTLFDKGQFHGSFDLKPEKDQFTTSGDEQKPDGKISDNVDLTGVMDLSEDETVKVARRILPDLRQIMRKQIGV